jgi:hypothetical protein
VGKNTCITALLGLLGLLGLLRLLYLMYLMYLLRPYRETYSLQKDNCKSSKKELFKA